MDRKFIMVLYHLSHYRTFKDFYLSCVCVNLKKEFPLLVSYNRFVELMQMAVIPLFTLLNCCKARETGKYYIDSTSLKVGHNLRIFKHKVFAGIAKRGKTSTGWFFGFKLHIVINEYGEIASFTLTSGNKADSSMVEQLTKKLKGWLFGDKGYISGKLTRNLLKQGLQLCTKIKKV